MNNKRHNGTVRCSCWHTTNPRILISGGDDRSIRIWRLYPHSFFPNNANKNVKNTEQKNDLSEEDDNDVELQYNSSSDGDINDAYHNFSPAIHPLIQMLALSASGQVKGLCMSPTNGELLVAISSRSLNEKSSLDIFHLPHWTWNYASLQRMSFREQYQKYISDGSTKDFQSSDFCDNPSVIPLPYGARERCITFSPSTSIVFVGLLSSRKKHQRKYCCLMACNITNGANRACNKINSIMHRKESICSLALSSAPSNSLNDTCYQLAIGTNVGRLIIVSLKQDLNWENTRRSFINDYNVGYEKDPRSTARNTLISNSNKIQFFKSDDRNRIRSISKKRNKKKGHSKTRSKKYSVLTARERTFREMVDSTVSITRESLSIYMRKQNPNIDKQDIDEFHKFLKPNKKGQISFTQYVQKVDEDGDIMKAFKQFCLTGSSRTDRRRWMDDQSVQSTVADIVIDVSKNADSSGEESHDFKTEDCNPVTAIQWSEYNSWIITGHLDGEIRFWSKELSIKPAFEDDEKYVKKKRSSPIPKSNFYFVKRGGMKRHMESVTALSLSGTYLVSSSIDGDILVWHLDFLAPSVISAQMQMRMQSSSGVVQLLSTIESAHMGEEICDVQLSYISSSAQCFVPNALYLLSSGADDSVRCRDVMEVLRQQLSIRILADSRQGVQRAYSSESGGERRVNGQNRKEMNIEYESQQRNQKYMHNVGRDEISDESSSDVGITQYGGNNQIDMDYREKLKRLTTARDLL